MFIKKTCKTFQTLQKHSEIHLMAEMLKHSLFYLFITCYMYDLSIINIWSVAIVRNSVLILLFKC